MKSVTAISGIAAFAMAMACSSEDQAGLPLSGAGSGATTGVGGNTGSGGGATGTTTSGIGGGLTGSSSGSGGAPPDCGSDLTGLIRDFKQSHPDFEYVVGDDLGIVTPDLGADGKPVYAGNPTTATTTGKANFDQWYRDVQDVNQKSELSIPLTDLGNGFFVYESNAFFPIDGKGWGDEGTRTTTTSPSSSTPSSSTKGARPSRSRMTTICSSTSTTSSRSIWVGYTARRTPRSIWTRAPPRSASFKARPIHSTSSSPNAICRSRTSRSRPRSPASRRSLRPNRALRRFLGRYAGSETPFGSATLNEQWKQFVRDAIVRVVT